MKKIIITMLILFAASAMAATTKYIAPIPRNGYNVVATINFGIVNKTDLARIEKMLEPLYCEGRIDMKISYQYAPDGLYCAH